MELQKWLDPHGFDCSCGKHHSALPLRSLTIEPGALRRLPNALRDMGIKRPFIVTDTPAKQAAGDAVLSMLADSGVPVSFICLTGTPKVLPNEEYLEQLEQAFDSCCDFVLGIGSGVVNDLCKMLACAHALPSGIVATAPSMDGYASNSSAMELAGIKTTVYTACPSLILCDTEILRKAPARMISAGFGDMAAKVISIADWRIAHIVTGEYYCESIAAMMTEACEKVLANAEGILRGEERAIRHMTEGLILSGIAMSCAGVSRPASGTEHTVSHLLEMFALARGGHPDLHGLQVGYGVRAALRLYQQALRFRPSRESCVDACDAFDPVEWENQMHQVFGAQADELIRSAIAEQRNSRENRLKRGFRAVEHWPEIRQIISGVVGQCSQLLDSLDRMEIPQLGEPEKLGYSPDEAGNAVRFSKDLRSRYIFTSLCSDIGMELDIEEMCL